MGVLLIARRKSIVKSIDIVSYTGTYEKNSNGDVRFLTSGTLVLENSVTIDAFLVGGGGGGGTYRSGGGGGGYTKTARKIQLVAGQEYEIVIGEGGASVKGSPGETGGTTSAFGYTAKGGAGGGTNATGNRKGGTGGSGGGGGASTGGKAGAGGSNGGNGGAGSGGSNTSGNGAAGTGQGYTTRAFGEEYGNVYAGGGAGASANGNDVTTIVAGGAGGGGNSAEAGKENTGGGGGGGGYVNADGVGGAGGSGIVIIRAAKAVGRQYLYSAGDEHTGFTNGWIGEAKWSQDGSGATKRANIARESGQIVLDNSGNYAGVIRPALGVDMTPYKTLVFEGEFTRGGSVPRNLTAAVWSTIGTFYATENQMLKSYQMANTGTVNRIELDVSDIDGLGYPGIGLTTSSAKITACYLIPKD